MGLVQIDAGHFTHPFEVERSASMAGEVSSPGESNKAGGVPESNHDMISPITTDTNSIYCLASVSSIISTGHKIYFPSILEKELYLQATIYSQNKNAIAAAKQHTVTILTARARTPLGSLDPNSLSSKLRQCSNFLSNYFSILIYSYMFFFKHHISHYIQSRCRLPRSKAACRLDAHLSSLYYSRISRSRGVSGSKLVPPGIGSWLSVSHEPSHWY
jgi:hypothetical protein